MYNLSISLESFNKKTLRGQTNPIGYAVPCTYPETRQAIELIELLNTNFWNCSFCTPKVEDNGFQIWSLCFFRINFKRLFRFNFRKLQVQHPPVTFHYTALVGVAIYGGLLQSIGILLQLGGVDGWNNRDKLLINSCRMIKHCFGHSNKSGKSLKGSPHWERHQLDELPSKGLS